MLVVIVGSSHDSSLDLDDCHDGEDADGKHQYDGPSECNCHHVMMAMLASVFYMHGPCLAKTTLSHMSPA